MRLINTETLLLEEFFSTEIPPYAILSHTWGGEEVSFHEYQGSFRSERSKSGLEKIKQFCRQAALYSYQYAWVDTCCIDKRNSAELSEAINSMYRWYYGAGICLIYLADVPSHGNVIERIQSLQSSRWFTRGWTLQELIAPKRREFYAADWTHISGTSDNGLNLTDQLVQITLVSKDILLDRHKVKSICVAERMSWAASRDTTRPEDSAYSLMGLFNVSMPIMYGEGELNAFKRLQLEIMKESFDQTLFAWHSRYESSGLLARKVSDFKDMPELGLWSPIMLAPYMMTNIGLSIRVPFVDKPVPHDPSLLYVALQCDIKTAEGWKVLMICLRQVEGAYCIVNGKFCKAYRRVQTSGWPSVVGLQLHRDYCEDILVLEDGHIELVQQSVDADHTRWGRHSNHEIQRKMSQWFYQQAK